MTDPPAPRGAASESAVRVRKSVGVLRRGRGTIERARTRTFCSATPLARPHARSSAPSRTRRARTATASRPRATRARFEKDIRERKSISRDNDN
eukprot:31498-Pelagococcus_subviridis.AAC.15